MACDHKNSFACFETRQYRMGTRTHSESLKKPHMGSQKPVNPDDSRLSDAQALGGTGRERRGQRTEGGTGAGKGHRRKTRRGEGEALGKVRNRHGSTERNPVVEASGGRTGAGGGGPASPCPPPAPARATAWRIPTGPSLQRFPDEPNGAGGSGRSGSSLVVYLCVSLSKRYRHPDTSSSYVIDRMPHIICTQDVRTIPTNETTF